MPNFSSIHEMQNSKKDIQEKSDEKFNIEKIIQKYQHSKVMTEQNLENIKDGLIKTSVAEIKMKG